MREIALFSGKIYTAGGRDGRDKSQICSNSVDIVADVENDVKESFGSRLMIADSFGFTVWQQIQVSFPIACCSCLLNYSDKSVQFGPKSALFVESTLDIVSRLLILPVLEDIRSRH